MQGFNWKIPLIKSLNSTLMEHRIQAKGDFMLYKSCQEQAAGSPDVIHIVFDFAEKVLLPRISKQPGQLNYITSLIFDIFGVLCSNFKTNFLFGFTEGHWPNTKTVNVVCSMVNHVLGACKAPGQLTENAKTLHLHADNWSGQDENRFFL